MSRAGFRTDTGKVRVNNEDALLFLPKQGAYAVADGVGGQNSGEIASRGAMAAFEGFLSQNPPKPESGLEGCSRDDWFEGYFIRCFEKMNSDILDIARNNPASAGMATTAVTCYIDGARLYVTNIGDSRAYLIRDGGILQLTEDHSFLNKLIKSGMLTKDEAARHPQKNMITRALGVDQASEPDFYAFDIIEGDKVLLCTDGLHGELSDDEIREIILGDGDLDAVCGKLAAAANEHGGYDNITVICIEV